MPTLLRRLNFRHCSGQVWRLACTVQNGVPGVSPDPSEVIVVSACVMSTRCFAGCFGCVDRPHRHVVVRAVDIGPGCRHTRCTTGVHGVVLHQYHFDAQWLPGGLWCKGPWHHAHVAACTVEPAGCMARAVGAAWCSTSCLSLCTLANLGLISLVMPLTRAGWELWGDLPCAWRYTPA